MNPQDIIATGEAQALVNVLASMSSKESVAALLVDLCTPREIEELSQRLEVARLLDAGEPYLSVQQRTGSSSTTVSRVSKCLNGKVGGYRCALDHLDALSDSVCGA